MRVDAVRSLIESPEEVFEKYEKFKRDFKFTSQACEAANFRFVPLILEVHGGGWCGSLRALLDWIARVSASWQRELLSVISLRTAQRIPVTLQRESARAVLKRISPAQVPDAGGGTLVSPGDLWQ